MDIRFLESLLAVVDAGSLAGAARMQGLTAAAVSQRVKVLEADFGCSLFERTAHSAKPTAACLRMLPAAKELVQNAKRLPSYLQADGLSGPYRLGVISTALLDYIPGVLRHFEAEAPQVEVNIRPGTSESLYKELISGDLDGAVTVSPPFRLPKDLRIHDLVQQSFCHIQPMESVVENRAGSPLPWIVYERSSWGGRLISSHLAERIEGGQVLCELDALETIAAMVEQGLGQALLPDWCGMRAQFPRIRINMLSNGTQSKRDIVFLDRHSSSDTQVRDFAVRALIANTRVRSECS